MSTYWHFECLDHDPALPSADEFTQHTDDAAYRNALALAAQRPLDPAWWDGDQGGDGGYMERNARRFLDAHPHCRIAAVSEHGDRVQISQPTPGADGIDDVMIEAAARAMFEGADGIGLGGTSRRVGWDDVVRENAPRADLWRADARTVLRAVAAVGRPVSADPPSIADMVPGTTFTAHVLGSPTRRPWRLLEDGRVHIEDHMGGWNLPDAIDPSTIRDVTPPAVIS